MPRLLLILNIYLALPLFNRFYTYFFPFFNRLLFFYIITHFLLALQHKKSTENNNSQCFLTSLRGVEPPAYRLGGGRSILLSYSDLYMIRNFPNYITI